MRLKNYYRNTLAEDIALKSNGNFRLVEQATSPTVVLHLSSSEAVEERKELIALKILMEQIACKSPVRTKAKMSVSNYKLREGTDLGLKVTLNKNSAWEFINVWVSIILPYLLYYEMTKGVPIVFQNGIIYTSVIDIKELPQIYRYRHKWAKWLPKKKIGIDVQIHLKSDFQYLPIPITLNKDKDREK